MKPVFFCLFIALIGPHYSLHAQTEGDQFFPVWMVHEIRFQFSQPGYWDSLQANYPLDRYMRCDVTVDGVAYSECGVKFKGNSSYNNPGVKKPFRIDFAEYVDGQAHDGLKKLVLNNAFKDPTLLREKLMLDFLNAHGIAAPRATFSRLYVNGHYWGLYSVVEDVNKTFLQDRFDNKDGNLFKGDPKGTLVWKGPDQNLYQGDYELKTNETANDWSDLLSYLNALNNTPAGQLTDSLERYVRLDSWADYWAAHSLFVNLDSYIGSGHNYFLYHRTDTGQFEWITWDVNEAFGNFQMNMPLASLEALPFGYIPPPLQQRPMMNRLWSDLAFRQRLADRLCALLTDFTSAKMTARIDSLAALIRADVYADSLKFFTNDRFEQNLGQDLAGGGAPGVGTMAGLKPFVAIRRAALLQQLAGFGCNLSPVTEGIAVGNVEVAPNPTTDRIVVRGVDLQRIELFSLSGRSLATWTAEAGEETDLELRRFPAGLYCLRIQTGSATYVRRVSLVR